MTDTDRTTDTYPALDVSPVPQPATDAVAFGVPGQLVPLRRWAFQDVLLVPAETAAAAPDDAPGTTVSFACVLSQVDEIAAACADLRPGSVQGPREMPRNSVEVEVRTPENARVFTTAATTYLPDSDEAPFLRDVEKRAPINARCRSASTRAASLPGAVPARHAVANYDARHPGLATWLHEAIAANARVHGVDPATASWTSHRQVRRRRINAGSLDLPRSRSTVPRPRREGALRGTRREFVMVEKKAPAGGKSSAGRGRRTSDKKSGTHLSCEQAVGDVGGTALIDGYGFASLPVVWVEVDGLALVEGDIVIGTVEEARARDVSTLTADEDGSDVAHAVGISGAQFRWPNGVIPFEIDAGLSNPSRVHNAIAHWHAKTPLRLVPRNGETNFVRFVGGGGCSSAVGRRGNQQNITLGPSCSVGNTIHEIGHAYGLWHEQSREDRDAFVQINWANIEAGKEHNFNQRISDGDDLGGYDFGSIMHYPTTAFSSNGQPTIVPIGTVPPGTVIGQRTSLSAGDIAGLKIMYPGLAWPKTAIKDIVKEPVGEGTVTIKETFKDTGKEPVKEPFKEVVKEPRDEVVKPLRDLTKPFRDPQPTIREVVEPLRPETPLINPALKRSVPFVIGRDSDFVSRFQAAVAQQSGTAEQDTGATSSAADQALALAEVITTLDAVREALAALAEQAAAEAGI
ncbi:M12 family metallopeptidase [Oerskovia flava]|uniref:M12 family metallopeptidase n=1 Tax=Oerskovia flava TaxID=2986422 RepID=UPI00224042ED|nr:M12 family metallopeptidase [Oerskovia sp. JB1-3-2]